MGAELIEAGNHALSLHLSEVFMKFRFDVAALKAAVRITDGLMIGKAFVLFAIVITSIES